MTTEEARRFLQSVFDRLFDPAASAEDVGAFFSPDYVQDVDGRRLDRGEFLNHVRVLKSTLDSASVTFKEIAADGATIADIHGQVGLAGGTREPTTDVVVLAGLVVVDADQHVCRPLWR